MKISPARQRNAVSEGMALGLLMCERTELLSDKWILDLAFEGAWRNWPYNKRFSQVNADLRNGSDGTRVMTRADEDKHVLNLFWGKNSGKFTICARPQWVGEKVDPRAVADTIGGDVPAEGWRALAEDFLVRFDR